MRLILAALTIACLFALPSTSAHPLEECGGAGGSYREPAFWIDAWAKDPIDEDAEGDPLHKFNSLGCVDTRMT